MDKNKGKCDAKYCEKCDKKVTEACGRCVCHDCPKAACAFAKRSESMTEEKERMIIHYVKVGDSLFGISEWYCKKADKDIMEYGSFDAYRVNCPKCMKFKEYRDAMKMEMKEREYPEIRVNEGGDRDWEAELEGARVVGVMEGASGFSPMKVVGIKLENTKTKKFYWVDVKETKE